MAQSFRFRYANELAGGLVLLAMGLLVAGILAAGRAQGWFEGRFTVRVLFTTAEGSFGLQEGDEVRVRNTAAGRVSRIAPTELGQMEASLVIRQRFHPFVHINSVARVRKLFGVTGDSFVEIGPGNGPPVLDGDVLECARDEELLDMAQRMLRELEAVMVPLLDQAEELLGRANSLVAGVEGGHGVVGAVLTDDALSADVRSGVESAARLLAGMSAAIEEKRGLVGTLLGDPEMAGDVAATLESLRQVAGRIENSVSTREGVAGAVLNDAELADGVREAVDNLNGLLSESRATAYETRRLVRAAQKSFLLRKHVEQELPPPVVDVYERSAPAELHAAARETSQRRRAAEAADDLPERLLAGYQAGAVRLAMGELDAARVMADELAVETAGAAPRDSGPWADLLRSMIARAEGNTNAALSHASAALARLGRRPDPGVEAVCRVELARAMRLAGMSREARDQQKRGAAAATKSGLLPMQALASSVLAELMASSGDLKGAGGQYDREASLLREDGHLFGMADALLDAGRAYDAAGDHAVSADRFLRAGRSLLAAKHTEDAAVALELGRAAVTQAGDPALEARLALLDSSLRREMED